jgi:hypothetical protein
LLILGKLDETLQQLRTIHSGLGLDTSSSALVPSTWERDTGVTPARSENIVSSCSSDCLEVLAAFGSTDCILSWPIFGREWPEQLLQQDVLTCTASSPNAIQDQLGSQQRKKRGINDEDIPSLVEQFLRFVHSKNPILEARQLREAARKVTEHGLSWDSSSCIVVRKYQGSPRRLFADLVSSYCPVP